MLVVVDIVENVIVVGFACLVLLVVDPPSENIAANVAHNAEYL